MNFLIMILKSYTKDAETNPNRAFFLSETYDDVTCPEKYGWVIGGILNSKIKIINLSGRILIDKSAQF